MTVQSAAVHEMMGLVLAQDTSHPVVGAYQLILKGVVAPKLVELTKPLLVTHEPPVQRNSVSLPENPLTEVGRSRFGDDADVPELVFDPTLAAQAALDPASHLQTY